MKSRLKRQSIFTVFSGLFERKKNIVFRKFQPHKIGNIMYFGPVPVVGIAPEESLPVSPCEFS